jgi:hypothetical protein
MKSKSQRVSETHAGRIDESKLNAFLERAITDLGAGYGGVMVSLGRHLGLYQALAGAGPLSSNEVALRAACAERYVREWLSSQVAGGYVAYTLHPNLRVVARTSGRAGRRA